MSSYLTILRKTRLNCRKISCNLGKKHQNCGTITLRIVCISQNCEITLQFWHFPPNNCELMIKKIVRIVRYNPRILGSHKGLERYGDGKKKWDGRKNIYHCFWIFLQYFCVPTWESLRKCKWWPNFYFWLN